MVSVKGGCLDGLDWRKAIHIWTSSAMVPIPEGSETHSEESAYTDYGEIQEDLDQPVGLTGAGGDPDDEGRDGGLLRKPVGCACELSGGVLPPA